MLTIKNVYYMTCVMDARMALQVIERLYQRGIVLRLKSMKLREPTTDELMSMLEEDYPNPDDDPSPITLVSSKED